MLVPDDLDQRPPGPLGLPFEEVWLIDTEFISPDGEGVTEVVCVVAREVGTDRLVRIWKDDLGDTPPFRTDDGVLFVAFMAAAEWSCFDVLGWPVPECTLDLYVEGRAEVNGHVTAGGSGLLGVLARHGIATISKDEKTEMRDVIMRGGPWSDDEREAILDYCQGDVDPMGPLLASMLPGIRRQHVSGLERALLRGRYMATVARIEANGVPLDVDTLEEIRTHWETIKLGLIEAVDEAFDVYDGTTFRKWRFAEYLKRERIAWPRLDSGALALDGDTFRDMSRVHAQVEPLKELRGTLGELRLEGLLVGSDGRNRASVMPFRARTGRNQPSNTKFIFGPSSWIRHLITPPEGRALVYLDWGAQEIAIAAALSNDPAMLEAMLSGDPYLSFAKQAKLVPADTQKHDDCHCTTCQVRGACKTVVLGANYGMSAPTLAYRIGQSMLDAEALLSTLRRTWRTFFEWRENLVDHALLNGRIDSVFGWPMRVGPDTTLNALRNYQMQANGAEMLRVGAMLTSEAGVDIAALVHDAILIECDLDDIDRSIAVTREQMNTASREVLNGFEVPRIDAKILRPGDRYSDGRGVQLWETVTGLARDAASGIA